MKRCCICHGPLDDKWGNSPDDAVWKNPDGTIEFPEFGPEDRCCNSCNGKYVIPGRLYKMRHAEGEENAKTDVGRP